jgi:uncharacterized protein DUF4252
MKIPVFLSAFFLTISIAVGQPQPSSQKPQDWMPQAIADLTQTATSHSDFTFDHSMLVLASKVDQDDDNLRRVIAGVDGVSVHRFRFQNGVPYSSEILNAVRGEYHADGWEHLAAGRHNDGAETDLFFRLENSAIREMAFLVIGRDHISFVTVAGSVSPIDLLHLGGHFGIPPIEGGVKIPSTAASQGAPQRAY